MFSRPLFPSSKKPKGVNIKMITGSVGQEVIVVESLGSPFEFTQDCQSVSQSVLPDGSFYNLTNTFVDAHVYKAIFILKRGV